MFVIPFCQCLQFLFTFSGSKTPRIIDKLQGLQVEKIYAGGQFSAALCRNGALYTWGKGMGYRYVINSLKNSIWCTEIKFFHDYFLQFRLGHGGSEDHVRFPKMIEALLGKRIAHVAPGLSNMVIVTEDHQMIAWGANDYGQFGKLISVSGIEKESSVFPWKW